MIIVTICKNDPECLKRTSASVLDALKQGLHIDLWVIKLSSPDDTSLSFTEELPDFCLVNTETDSSIYDAFNKAISSIPDKLGDCYTMLLNAGDEINCDDLNENKIFLSCSRVKSNVKNECRVFEAKTTDGQSILPYEKIIGVGGLNFCHQSALFKASLLKSNPFPIKYRIAGDYAHFISVDGVNVSVVNESIVIFDCLGVSSSSVFRTRFDNFRAGFDRFGAREFVRLSYMLLYRYFKRHRG